MLARRSICFGLALLVLAACGRDEPWLKTKGDDGNGSGPFTASNDTPVFRVGADQASAQTQLQFSITNLLGDVRVHRLQPNMSEEIIRVVVALEGGALPPVLDLRQMDEGWHFLALDSVDALYQSTPVSPVNFRDGRVQRLNTFVPRVDLDVYVADETLVRVQACADLRVDARIDLIARCGSKATLAGGRGKAVISAPRLLSSTNTFSTIATITEEAWFSDVIGYRGVRGSGKVIFTGGGGIADVDVDGDVVVRGAVAGGSPRGFSGGSYLDDSALELIGPQRPILGEREHAKAASEVTSSIRGNVVELYLPRSLSLEIMADVASGTVELWLPSAAPIVQHDMTRSTAHFSLGNPHGELRVAARRSAKIIIE